MPKLLFWLFYGRHYKLTLEGRWNYRERISKEVLLGLSQGGLQVWNEWQGWQSTNTGSSRKYLLQHCECALILHMNVTFSAVRLCVCLSYHVTEMPVVLVFGVATTIDSIHRSLPHRVTSLLSMEKFQAPASSDYLSMVLRQVSNFVFYLWS